MATPPKSQGDFSITAPTPRIVSVDALRGFVMFWIVGGDNLVGALSKTIPGGIFPFLSYEMNHRPWEGVAFYDLIFPLFIFIAGVSIVLSMSRTLEQSSRSLTVRRLIYRSAILFFLGVFIYGGLANGWENIRWLGVLQRIALCYLFTGIAFVFFKLRGLIAVFLLLLFGYWAAMTYIPIRNINLEKEHLKQAYAQAGHADAGLLFRETSARVSGRFEEGLNLANHFDFQYLPGRKWDGAYDPEGLLSTVPAIATCIFGVLAGLLLKSTQITEQRKVYILLGIGVAGILLGQLWGIQFPVVKKLWTSSYVLVSGGYSCLFLAWFYQVIDIWGWRRWCIPLLWFGMNSIAIYLIYHLVDFYGLADRIAGGPVKVRMGEWAEPFLTATVMLMVAALVRALYQRKIFIKL